MNALDRLQQDHDKVRDLASRFETAQESDDTEQMRSLAEKICAELEVHAAIEEAVFYPAVRELDDEKLTELVAESIEEHRVVKTLVKEITSLAESSDEKLAAKTTVLIENVEHHASEEEDEMFPLVRQQMSAEQLDELGRELENAKSNA